jgi:hypothetical protein
LGKNYDEFSSSVESAALEAGSDGELGGMGGMIRAETTGVVACR